MKPPHFIAIARLVCAMFAICIPHLSALGIWLEFSMVLSLAYFVIALVLSLKDGNVLTRLKGLICVGFVHGVLEVNVIDEVVQALSINEFLKPAEGEKYYNPGGRGDRGGCGGRGGSRGGGYGANAYNNVPAPSIEDIVQFPTLGGCK